MEHVIVRRTSGCLTSAVQLIQDPKTQGIEITTKYKAWWLAAQKIPKGLYFHQKKRAGGGRWKWRSSRLNLRSCRFPRRKLDFLVCGGVQTCTTHKKVTNHYYSRSGLFSADFKLFSRGRFSPHRHIIGDPILVRTLTFNYASPDLGLREIGL